MAPTLSIPVSDLTLTSANDIKAVPVWSSFHVSPMSTSCISLPCSHSSQLLRLSEGGLERAGVLRDPTTPFPQAAYLCQASHSS